MTETAERKTWVVVHPLDAPPEMKVNVDALGLMTMTPSVKYSLFAIQGHLVLMLCLVAYHVLDLAGAFKHLAH